MDLSEEDWLQISGQVIWILFVCKKLGKNILKILFFSDYVG